MTNMNGFFPLGSIRYVEDPRMGDRKQIRFPKTKNRRIRKKWAKRQENYGTVPWDYLVRIGDTFFGHPLTIFKMRNELVKRGLA